MTRFDFASAIKDSARSNVRDPGDHSSVPGSIAQLASEIRSAVEHDPTGFVATLHRSLADSAKRLDQVSLAVTGLAWLGAGVPSVQQEAVSIIQAARFEIIVCAYSITSGANPLLDLISQVAKQGVSATLLMNDFYNQPQQTQRLLLDMAQACAGRIRLFNFRPDNPLAQLHAKVVVADRNTALVGSAHLIFSVVHLACSTLRPMGDILLSVTSKSVVESLRRPLWGAIQGRGSGPNAGLQQRGHGQGCEIDQP